jgi:hypothetical protein
MDNFEIISSIDSLPLPEVLHVRDFDERQKAIKQAARAAKKAAAATPAAAQQIRRPAKTKGTSVTRVGENTTTVAVSKKSQFNQTIIIPDAIDALFGMTAEERFAEVKRACERDEVTALTTYVAPLTTWINDLDYVMDNYGDVVQALEQHFNKPGRPETIRATWGDMSFDTETLKYIQEKFGYKTETPISWAGICHVFFNRSIRTMQRRKAYKSMLTSGETVIPPKHNRERTGTRGSSGSNKRIDPAEHTEAKNIASLAVRWASENPDNDNAQAIMKIATDRANRLAQNIPLFELNSGMNGNTETTPEPLNPPQDLARSAAQMTTYLNWENHHLPAPEFKRKYFADAAEDFKDRYHYAFQSAPFKRILELLEAKPDQVLSNARDLAELAQVLRGAGENANLLASVITTAINPPQSPEPQPTPEQGSPSLERQGSSDCQRTELGNGIVRVDFNDGVRVHYLQKDGKRMGEQQVNKFVREREAKSRDLKILEEWAKSHVGDAKKAKAECEGLSSTKVKYTLALLEELAASGRISATDLPNRHLIGQYACLGPELVEKLKHGAFHIDSQPSERAAGKGAADPQVTEIGDKSQPTSTGSTSSSSRT